MATHQRSIQSEIIKLGEYPATKIPAQQSWVNVGDMHGNSLKILHTLIKSGVLELSQADYKEFVKIYGSLPEYGSGHGRIGMMAESPAHKDFWTKVPNRDRDDKMAAMQAIIGRMQKGPNAEQGAGIRFLGDVFADRGRNDLISLWMFEQLDKHKVPTEIIVSNHDKGLIDFKESGGTKMPDGLPAQWSSVYALKHSLDSGQLAKEEFERLYKTYSKNINFLSYEERPDGKLVLYQHSRPANPRIYNAMADYLNIALPFNAQTGQFDKERLKAVIDQMNIKFKEFIVNGTVSTQGVSGPGKPNFQDLLDMVAWGERGAAYKKLGLDRNIPENNDQAVLFTHGHEGPGQRDPRMANLDTNLGKGLAAGQDEFAYTTTPRAPAPAPAAASPPAVAGPAAQAGGPVAAAPQRVLNVFDFDGTLTTTAGRDMVNSPAYKRWEQASGKSYGRDFQKGEQLVFTKQASVDAIKKNKLLEALLPNAIPLLKHLLKQQPREQVVICTRNLPQFVQDLLVTSQTFSVEELQRLKIIPATRTKELALRDAGITGEGYDQVRVYDDDPGDRASMAGLFGGKAVTPQVGQQLSGTDPIPGQYQLGVELENARQRAAVASAPRQAAGAAAPLPTPPRIARGAVGPAAPSHRRAATPPPSARRPVVSPPPPHLLQPAAPPPPAVGAAAGQPQGPRRSLPDDLAVLGIDSSNIEDRRADDFLPYHSKKIIFGNERNKDLSLRVMTNVLGKQPDLYTDTKGQYCVFLTQQQTQALQLEAGRQRNDIESISAQTVQVHGQLQQAGYRGDMAPPNQLHGETPLDYAEKVRGHFTKLLDTHLAQQQAGSGRAASPARSPRAASPPPANRFTNSMAAVQVVLNNYKTRSSRPVQLVGMSDAKPHSQQEGYKYKLFFNSVEDVQSVANRFRAAGCDQSGLLIPQNYIDSQGKPCVLISPAGLAAINNAAAKVTGPAGARPLYDHHRRPSPAHGVGHAFPPPPPPRTPRGGGSGGHGR